MHAKCRKTTERSVLRTTGIQQVRNAEKRGYVVNRIDLVGLSEQLWSVRGHCRATGPPCQLSAEDETVRCVAAYLLRGVQAKSEKVYGADHCAHLHQDRALRDANRKMFDRGYIEQDGSVCKVCGWANSQISARCRGICGLTVCPMAGGGPDGDGQKTGLVCMRALFL